MDKNDVIEIQREIDQMRLRKGNIKSRELASLAVRLGRTLAKRGKEPTYITGLPGTRPISIPSHGSSQGGTLKIGTAGNILNQLEADLDRFREILGMEANDGS